MIELSESRYAVIPAQVCVVGADAAFFVRNSFAYFGWKELNFSRLMVRRRMQLCGGRWRNYSIN